MSDSGQRTLNVLEYGPGGVGKTTASVRALPPQATFYLECEKGGLDVLYRDTLNLWRDSAGRILLPPKAQIATCLSTDDPYGEVMRVIEKQLAPMVKRGQVAAALVTTLSALAARDHDRMMGPVASRDNFGSASERTGRHLRDIIATLQELGIALVVEAHERPPKTGMDGALQKGGPAFPGKHAETVFQMFSTVLRAGIWVNGTGEKHRAFFCDPMDTNWMTRDRSDVVQGVVPMDLGAVLGAIQAQMLAAANGR